MNPRHRPFAMPAVLVLADGAILEQRTNIRKVRIDGGRPTGRTNALSSWKNSIIKMKED